MNKKVFLVTAISGLLYGAIAALLPLRLFGAVVVVLAAAVLLLLDYERITYVVAVYVFIDFIVRKVMGQGILGAIWDELLLMAAFAVWVYKWFACRRTKAYRWTPLDIPLLFFFGIGIFLLIVNSPDLAISIEGLRAVIEYMFWYFLVIQILKTRKAAINICRILVLSMAVLAVHGIIQYILGVEIPKNWVDMAEKEVRSRAFSIVGSPNILGSLMLMLFPVSLSLFYIENTRLKKLLYLFIAGAMGLCLVFTLSRGAWLCMIICVCIYILMKDKRLFIPFIVFALFVLAFVPSVANRILYMLSPQYIASSMRGGRLGRWIIGLEKLRENLLFGVGLGHFGGAVAMNNKIPGTFYMDNYYLKTAVEMGITGLTAFLILCYNVVIQSLRGIVRSDNRTDRELMQGIFAGLCGVLVHHIGENVFEVPMMVTYFWTLAAIIMFLAYKKEDTCPSQ